MSIKRERKITFPSVGIIEGSRVWRNSETGVEIIKGKNFKEVGLYYVCVPTGRIDHDRRNGRRIVATRISLTEAREVAAAYALKWRIAVIAKAYTEAILEDSSRDGQRLAAVRDVVTNRGALGQIPGSVPGGLCVRDQFGREHVTMRIPGQFAQRVTFTSGVSRARADVADWIVVADYRNRS